MSTSPKPEKIIRVSAVSHLTGLSRSTVNRLVRQNLFPKPRQISAGAVGWIESEVTDWIQTRPKVGYAIARTEA